MVVYGRDKRPAIRARKSSTTRSRTSRFGWKCSFHATKDQKPARKVIWLCRAQDEIGLLVVASEDQKKAECRLVVYRITSESVIVWHTASRPA
jgi:hypothetical protein